MANAPTAVNTTVVATGSRQPAFGARRRAQDVSRTKPDPVTAATGPRTTAQTRTAALALTGATR